LRLIFLGTPDFAVPALRALARAHEVALVVAQPDKRAGRGLKLHSPPIARLAEDLGLPLAQPARIREVLSQVADLRPDVGIVVAYGKILPPELLSIPKNGFFNVHASLLPKYRGAAPIQRAILNGETTTGITIMRVDEQLDHGPILTTETTPIGADEHAPSLSERLARLGADRLVRVLDNITPGKPQDAAMATYAPKIEKQEGEVRWSDPTALTYNKFRAFDPWPGVFTDDLKLIDLRPASGSGSPGQIVSIDAAGVTVATGDGAITLITLQRAGRARMAAAEFARGAGWRVGAPLK
jgi:methionyl-tRNA formyltransferase